MSERSTTLTGVTNAPEPTGFLPERSPASATWRWVLLDPSGSETSLPTGLAAGPAAGPAGSSFTSQSDAETWVGEQWRDLLEAGVESVTLVDGDRAVYGPMSLRPAGG